MDIAAELDAAIATVQEAKPRALGSGAIVDKEQLLAQLDYLRANLPEAMQTATQVVRDADAIRQQAHAEAEHIVAEAQQRATQLVGENEITVAAHQQAQEIVYQANDQAAHKQAEIDAYVESKLASFEGVLLGTLDSVRHGRDKLANTVDVRDMNPEAAEQYVE